MTPLAPSILVIGVGNEYRGDDGLGILAARQLRKRLIAEARIIESPCADTSLMETWKQYDSVILIDAVLSRSPPGTIHRFDARACTMPPHFCHCSSHAFGLADAIELARVMDWLPQNLIIYGVEKKECADDSSLSTEVAQALPNLVDRICAESKQLRQRMHDEGNRFC
ncbi:MAG: hydrogenase maturation protease [Limisphaerales bacterium]